MFLTSVENSSHLRKNGMRVILKFILFVGANAYILSSKPNIRKFHSHIFAYTAATIRTESNFIATPQNREAAFLKVHDTVSFTYTPRSETFFTNKGQPLTLIGGYNDWDPSSELDEPPAIFLQLRKVEGADSNSYTCSHTIPNFARSLKLLVTDGVKYDMGSAEGSEFYNVHVRHIEIVDPETNVLGIYEQEESTGGVRRIGTVDRMDPLELEKMLRAEQERRGIKDGLDDEEQAEEQAEELAETETETIKIETLSVDANRGVDTILTMGSEEDEQNIRNFLAEADVVGKTLGMGNMEIGEARNAYMKFDSEGTGLIGGIESIMEVLEECGFADVTVEEAERVAEIVLEKQKGNDVFGMTAWVRMYCYFDREGVGIDMT